MLWGDFAGSLVVVRERIGVVKLLMQNITRILYVLTIALLATGTVATAGDLTYDYDKLNRLTKETYSDGSVINYTYDAYGNRKQVYVTPFNDFTASTTC